MGGSQDVSTGVLWLPPSQSIPPHQHPHQLGQPMWHPVPGDPPPCTLAYLLAEGPAVLAGQRGGCRAVPCCAERVVEVLLPAHHSWADRQSHPPSTQPSPSTQP